MTPSPPSIPTKKKKRTLKMNLLTLHPHSPWKTSPSRRPASLLKADNIGGGGRKKSLLKTKLFLRNSPTASQYSFSQNKSKCSNTARIAILPPTSTIFSVGKKGEKQGRGGTVGEKEISSLGDLRQKISLLVE